MSRADVLRSLDLFSGLNATEIDEIARMCFERSYGAGDALFLEGQPCAGLWVLASGSAKLVKTTPQGRHVLLATQAAPSTIAEVPVFDGGPYPATLIAVRQVEALLIAREDFLSLCRTRPTLTMRLLAMFGTRLRHLVGLIEQITFGSIRQRLAQELIAKADVLGPTFRLDETHEQLAMKLGTVREVVSRNMSRFQAEGFIRVEHRAVTIADRQALASEAVTEF